MIVALQPPEAEVKTQVEPHRVLDDARRKLVTGIQDRLHTRTLLAATTFAKLPVTMSGAERRDGEAVESADGEDHPIVIGIERGTLECVRAFSEDQGIGAAAMIASKLGSTPPKTSLD